MASPKVRRLRKLARRKALGVNPVAPEPAAVVVETPVEPVKVPAKPAPVPSVAETKVKKTTKKKKLWTKED
jgi:hypothetical protein